MSGWKLCPVCAETARVARETATADDLAEGAVLGAELDRQLATAMERDRADRDNPKNYRDYQNDFMRS